ncbi:MAG: transglutaminase-like domain-containing protein [Pirellula sp.]|nr:transglutaminase-like domain-containing protein [Pirellula sp.]
MMPLPVSQKRHRMSARCFVSLWMLFAGMMVSDWPLAHAQDSNDAEPADSSSAGSANQGIEVFAPRKLDMQFGMRFFANDNICTQIVATIAFPTDWPEQRVTITESSIPPNALWQFRDLPLKAPTTARQLVMNIPVIQAGGELEFLFDVEIEKSFINPPKDTSVFVIPKKIGRDLNWAMGNSPLIDASTSDIKRLAKSIAASEPPDAWTHVERIYDWVRENIEYVNGPIRNTREAMKDKKGDCEEMTGIFIAICRASGIPARCVWIPDHCYPEFYLEDAEGKGHWFPCQVAGDRQFGQMHDYRPILQKGDRFKVPEKQAMQHYLSEFFTCKQRSVGPREPEVVPVLDLGPLKEEIEALQREGNRRNQN